MQDMSILPPLDQTPDSNGHYWSTCSMCGLTVICGTCGNNCCNGGRGELPDGTPCPDCESSWLKMESEMESKMPWENAWREAKELAESQRLYELYKWQMFELLTEYPQVKKYEELSFEDIDGILSEWKLGQCSHYTFKKLVDYCLTTNLGREVFGPSGTSYAL